MLVLQAVNPTDEAVAARIHLDGFVPMIPVVEVSELSGALDAHNTAEQPRAIVPQLRSWKHALDNGETPYTFPLRSVTVLRWE